MRYHNLGNRRKSEISENRLLSEAVREYLLDRHYIYVEDKEEFNCGLAIELSVIFTRRVKKEQLDIDKKNKETIKTSLEREVTKEFVVNMMSLYLDGCRPSEYQMSRHYATAIRIALITKLLFPEFNITNEDIGLDYKSDVVCSCGAITEFIEYPDHGRYICGKCNGQVRTVPGTNIPQGQPADAYTRFLRGVLHDKTASFHKNKHERASFYKEMSDVIGVAPSECHIGLMNKKQLIAVFNHYGLDKNATEDSLIPTGKPVGLHDNPE